MSVRSKKVAHLALETFSKNTGLTIGDNSHFENGYGTKYISAIPFTINLQNADARCGNRIGLVLHLPKGCIAILTGYLTPQKLVAELLSPSEDYQAKIDNYRRVNS